MATLVLSTVGTVLGGPMGGAIGSLLGQSIDQQLFGSGSRKGPRIGDLAVQSSAYGTHLPQLFGTIRVAGSIVWATDLKEDSQTQGAKGQPDTVTYSYSVSFAVALSCRKVEAIRRIWADGKLLRGASGDFKVSTEFRFYPGTENQPVDPLIGSIEGPSSTPAYRGLALAVFENLQLAEYGNRIPFLTFEVEADDVAPTVGEILNIASNGLIECSSSSTVMGYAAYGSAIADAVVPLTEHFAVELFDDGQVLRSPTAQLIKVGDDELGASASHETVSSRQRTQAAAQSLPTVLTLDYYDPARDYQSAQMRASTGAAEMTVRAERLAAVLTSDCAKGLAQTSLARRWAQRDTLVLRLMPNRLGLEPGTMVTTDDEQQPWSVVRVTVDGLAIVVELRPVVGLHAALPADPGRPLVVADVPPQPTTLALMELPAVESDGTTSPVIVVASTSPANVARSVPVDLEVSGLMHAIQTPRRQAVIGKSQTILPAGQAALLDLAAYVDVEVINPDHWLESCDDHALAAGANLAMLGHELLQFGSAEALGDRRFRLSRLLRGRRGTEWAMASHQAAEPFLVIEKQSLHRLDLTNSQIGAAISAKPRGLADQGAANVNLIVKGEALRPLSPVHLTAVHDPGGDLHCRWIRRSRLGWAWIDSVDAAIGQSRELYRVRIQSSVGAIEVETGASEASFQSQQMESLGGGPFSVSVVQVGDFAESHAATINIDQDIPNGP